jgi:hypothetical protein
MWLPSAAKEFPMKRFIQSIVALIALVTLSMLSGTNSATAAPPRKPSAHPVPGRPVLVPNGYGGYVTSPHITRVENRIEQQRLRREEGRRQEAFLEKQARQAQEQATKDAISRQMSQFSLPSLRLPF